MDILWFGSERLTVSSKCLVSLLQVNLESAFAVVSSLVPRQLPGVLTAGRAGENNKISEQFLSGSDKWELDGSCH